MSTERRSEAYREVVDQAIRAVGDGPVLPSDQFKQVVRNILYPHLPLNGEIPPHRLMNNLQSVIDKPLKLLNLDLSPAADQRQRVEDLGEFIFGQVSAHFARKRLDGEERRSDRPMPAAAEL